jgi:UDP-glucose 4-epimerase
MKKIQEGEAPVICGDGSQSMDFVNVHDVVEANILAMESDVCGEVFNVGSGTSTTVKELAETIIKSFKSNVKPVYQKEVKIIVQRRQAEISKIKKMLKFEPKVSLEEGLKEIAEDIVTHLNYY